MLSSTAAVDFAGAGASLSWLHRQLSAGKLRCERTERYANSIFSAGREEKSHGHECPEALGVTLSSITEACPTAGQIGPSAGRGRADRRVVMTLDHSPGGTNSCPRSKTASGTDCRLFEGNKYAEIHSGVRLFGTFEQKGKDEGI